MGQLSASLTGIVLTGSEELANDDKFVLGDAAEARSVVHGVLRPDDLPHTVRGSDATSNVDTFTRMYGNNLSLSVGGSPGFVGHAAIMPFAESINCPSP